MDGPRVLLVHPTSNPFSRNAALALGQAGWLREVVTSVAYDPTGHLASALRELPGSMWRRIDRGLMRRAWPSPGAPVRIHPVRETVRVALQKAGYLSRRFGSQLDLIDWVYKELDEHVSKSHLADIDAIYAYEDGAATSFRAARGQGIVCLYDLPIPYFETCRSIQQEEAALFPELAGALKATRESEEKLQRKRDEAQLAHHIFVASTFSMESLVRVGVDKQRISVIPYGSPIEYFAPSEEPNRGPFRVLFVGRVGPRKGVHYLLEAWRRLALPNAELLLVGVNEFPSSYPLTALPGVRYVPSMPHYELMGVYRSADVFAFPSLIEGFGLVLLEAMACGLCTVTTSNTAGPDIIQDGEDGFVLPIRNTEALCARLLWCYENREAVFLMGRKARAKAERFTWAAYRRSLVASIERVSAAGESARN